jgi:hypothetical protein
LKHRIDSITGSAPRTSLSVATTWRSPKLLVEAGIKVIPDNEGRMPSLIAALCEASEGLSDTITEAEEKALASHDRTE